MASSSPHPATPAAAPPRQTRETYVRANTAICDARQMRATPVQAIMNKYPTGSAIQRLTNLWWNTSARTKRHRYGRQSGSQRGRPVPLPNVWFCVPGPAGGCLAGDRGRPCQPEATLRFCWGWRGAKRGASGVGSPCDASPRSAPRAGRGLYLLGLLQGPVCRRGQLRIQLRWHPHPEEGDRPR